MSFSLWAFRFEIQYTILIGSLHPIFCCKITKVFIVCMIVADCISTFMFYSTSWFPQIMLYCMFIRPYVLTLTFELTFPGLRVLLILKLQTKTTQVMNMSMIMIMITIMTIIIMMTMTINMVSLILVLEAKSVFFPCLYFTKIYLIADA